MHNTRRIYAWIKKDVHVETCNDFFLSVLQCLVLNISLCCCYPFNVQGEVLLPVLCSWLSIFLCLLLPLECPGLSSFICTLSRCISLCLLLPLECPGLSSFICTHFMVKHFSLFAVIPTMSRAILLPVLCSMLSISLCCLLPFNVLIACRDSTSTVTQPKQQRTLSLHEQLYLSFIIL